MIRFVFGADTKELDDNVKQSKKEVSEFRKSMSEAAKSAAKWGAGMAAAAIGGLGVLTMQTMRAVESQSVLIKGTKQFTREAKDASGAARGISSALDSVSVKNITNAYAGVQDVTGALSGIGKQFTAQLAPAIEFGAAKIMEFIDSIGGIGHISEKAFGYLQDAIVITVNAIDGLKRVFDVTIDGIIYAFAKVQQKIAEVVIAMLELVNKIPGLDFSKQIESAKQFAATTKSVSEQAAHSINETLMAELQSERVGEFFEEAANHAKASAVRITEDQANALNERLEQIAQSYATEQELADAKYEQDLEAMAVALEQKLLLQSEYDEMRKKLTEKYNRDTEARTKATNDKLIALEKQKEDARRAILGGALSSLTTLMNSHSRGMFEVGKAAAISQAGISTYTGATKALELGWPLGPIAAAAISAAGFANVQSIASTSFGSSGGGSAASASVTEGVSAQAEQVTQRNINIDVQGQNVSRSQVRELIGAINEETGDNVRLNA